MLLVRRVEFDGRLHRKIPGAIYHVHARNNRAFPRSLPFTTGTFHSQPVQLVYRLLNFSYEYHPTAAGIVVRNKRRHQSRCVGVLIRRLFCLTQQHHGD
jgi:hypothetical protein